MGYAIIRQRATAAYRKHVTPETISKIRAKAKEKAEDTIEAAAVIAGGAAGGYIESEYGDKDLWGVNYGLIGGAALMVVGMMGWGGRSSHIAGSIGEGLLAYEAGKRVLNRAT